MDYEQKYKDVLEKLRDFYRDYDTVSHLIDVKDELANLFPELKESEDERMIKFIKQQLFNIKKTITDNYKLDTELTKAIDWLEKQGESDETKAKMFLMNKGYPIDANGTFPTYEEMYNIIREGLEEQSKQKSADKVEPKFKVGDWLVHNERKHIIKVVNPTPMVYEVVNILGYHHTITDTAIENNYHLWTIQDAKDGDVLAGEYDDCKKPWVGIFKCISENRPQTQFDSYCFITNSRHEFITPDSCYFCNRCEGHTIRYTIPATKEQRDILFQKMNEAGYEWDAEKKELKKISQRTISAEAKEAMYDKPANEEMIETLRTEYEKGRANAIAEMQKEWSEEDEKRIASILSVLSVQVCWDGATGKKENLYQEEIDWLKSLKNRVQPKQEWSEEDIFKVQRICKYLDEAKKYYADITEVRECIDWLKSLRPQSSWKPSDEQMKALHDLNLTGNISYAGQGQELIELYNDLLKLKA